MFNSVTSSFGKSANAWDTDYARKFLKIPDDQLKVLDSLPVRQLITGPGKKERVEGIVNLPIAESSLTKPVNTATSVHISQTCITNTNINKDMVNKTDIAKGSETTVTEKHKFLDSLSLSKSKQIAVSAVMPKSTSSGFVGNVSGLEDITFKMTKDVNPFAKSAEKHQMLNTTYVIQSVLDDKTNNPDTSDNPVKYQIFEKLGNPISKQQEPTSPAGPKFGGLPVFPTNLSQNPVDRENFLSKKLKLLEKRFSPSKEFSLVTPLENKKCHLKSASIQITQSFPEKSADLISQVNVASDELFNAASKATVNSNDYSTTSHSEVPEKEVQCAVSNDKQAFQSFPYSRVPEKVDTVFSSETQALQKECVENSPVKANASVFEEESFISQPIPCGQPPSDTQSSSKAIEPETQLPNTSQGVELVTKKNVDKVDEPLDVFYEKTSQHQVIDSAPSKVEKIGEKRKRKSKSDKASKRRSETKSISYIQYTAKQIEDMIEIIRNFRGEI